MNKKGQTRGLVTGLVIGIASLVVAVVIAFVLVSTLTGSDLLQQDSIEVLNEQGYANDTGYTLTGSSYVGAKGYSITSASNSSADTPIVLANFTISSLGVVENATKIAWSNVTFNYTYTRDSREIQVTDSLSGNFSEGVNNVSGKIPTLLLIAAIILIIGILAVLIGVWQRMRMGGKL